jgi:hypothetical protein
MSEEITVRVQTRNDAFWYIMYDLKMEYFDMG